MEWKKLVELLKGHVVYLQTHNFPDPDALSAAYGMQVFLRANGVKSTICYAGKIEKNSTKRMLDVFGIEAVHIDEIPDMLEEDYIVTLCSVAFSQNRNGGGFFGACGFNKLSYRGERFSRRDDVVDDKNLFALYEVYLIFAKIEMLFLLGCYGTNRNRNGVAHINLNALANYNVGFSRLTGHLVGKGYAFGLGGQDVIKLGCLAEKLCCGGNGDFGVAEKDKCGDIKAIGNGEFFKASLQPCNFHSIKF